LPLLNILCCTRFHYLDDSNGAAVSSRSLMQCLAGRGVRAEVLCGTIVDRITISEHKTLLERKGLTPSELLCRVDENGANEPIACRVVVDGVAVTIHHRPERAFHAPDEEEIAGFSQLFGGILAESKVDCAIFYGGDPLTLELMAEARRRGVRTVFMLHNFSYTRPEAFAHADAVIVPSQFAADYYREALGLDCEVLPNIVDPARVKASKHEPKYVTFVNPAVEKGVFAFARIAEELGKRRPEIPILVVESRGTEATVAACGIDLRERGNVFFMENTPDPRRFYRVSKVVIMPSLWWESHGLVASEAMANGIPVIASDRGALPETLGNAGIVLPLPDRLTPATNWLPTAEEVQPWVESIIRLWEDEDFYEEHRRRAIIEAERWSPETLGPRSIEFFERLISSTTPKPSTQPPGRAKSVVLVPHLNGIEWACEQSLQKLETAGVKVIRSEGSSQIDLARNQLASDALHDGFEQILFIDADIGFEPLDALRLLARAEPVVAGVYAKKGRRELASRFADGITDVGFGGAAFGLVPLKYPATGFLRIKSAILRAMISELTLPLCNADWGRGFWPFFQPTTVPTASGGVHYLGEDWSFGHRLSRIGVTPLADTSIRLWHFGRHSYGWEDAGADRPRQSSYRYHLTAKRE
jgi:glycosyltransferase involved in cell wall biosynthesis